MCRSCAQRPPGGKRCENPDRRRARQRAAYHARKAATTTDTRHTEPVTAENPAPPPGDGTPVTLEHIRDAIQAAWAAINATPPVEWFTTDVNGFTTPTPAGLTAEQAIRDVGALINRRAHQIAAERIARIDTEWEAKLAPHRDTETKLVTLGKAGDDAIETLHTAGLGTESIAHFGHLTGLLASGDVGPSEYERLINRVIQHETGHDLERAYTLSEARHTVLSEIRHMGPSTPLEMMHAGGPHDLDDMNRVHFAARYLPQDWIDAHNAAARHPEVTGVHPLIIARIPGKSRGAYTHRVRVPQMVETPPHLQGREKMSVLTVDDNQSGFLESGQATALHELVHRMQYTSMTALPHVEHVFLARRTMRDGTRDRLETYQGGNPGPATADTPVDATVEYVRPDQFVDRYVGKEYGDPYATEVAPMGFERVFAGVKAGGPKDTEHEDLILGMVATL